VLRYSKGLGVTPGSQEGVRGQGGRRLTGSEVGGFAAGGEVTG